MFEYVHEVVRKVETSTAASSAQAALAALRDELGLDDFGELMISLPLAEFPLLSRVLPRMASAEVQDQWTGTNGLALLRQSVNFVRSAACGFARLGGRPLNGVTMLDYGCGYGRLARLMYYFTNPGDVFGVDPWDRSIEICHACGLGENFRLSDCLPDQLPLPRHDFGLIYAFSVFTHLSGRAATTALDVCRRYIADDGVMVITIRPVEFWDLDASVHLERDTSELRARHVRNGFAFQVRDTPLIEGDANFGNTSMTVRWIVENSAGWTVAGIDRSLDDPYQLYVFLRPR